MSSAVDSVGSFFEDVGQSIASPFKAPELPEKEPVEQIDYTFQEMEKVEQIDAPVDSEEQKSVQGNQARARAAASRRSGQTGLFGNNNNPSLLG